MVKTDPRFEIPYPSRMALVLFMLKGGNELNTAYYKKINASGKIFLTKDVNNDEVYLRMSVNAEDTNEDDIKFTWEVLVDLADQVLSEHTNNVDKVKTMIEE